MQPQTTKPNPAHHLHLVKAAGVDLAALFTAPAVEVVDLQFRPWPDGQGGYYVATFETGEVLEAHDDAIAATVGVAFEQSRPVQLMVAGEEIIAAKLAAPRPKPLADLPQDLATQLQLSVVMDDIGRGLYDAAGIAAGQRDAWPTWKHLHPDVRETYRAAAILALSHARGIR